MTLSFSSLVLSPLSFSMWEGLRPWIKWDFDLSWAQAAAYKFPLEQYNSVQLLFPTKYVGSVLSQDKHLHFYVGILVGKERENPYLVQLRKTQKISLNNRLFKNIPHCGSFWQFVICCICVFVYFVFVFLYMHVWHMGTSLLIPFNNLVFKNIPPVGSFRHFVIFCICVFVYVCICIFVFVR